MPSEQALSVVDLTLNTIRGLSMDAVQAANSGHPGMPMGCAAMGYALFARHLKYDPEAPKWHDRDRFLLSAGHGSMLLYSLLFLTGYDLSLEELKRFRQWGSKTPGHPENFLTPGVEMATGPLGQGFATGVGMAIAEEHLRAKFPQHVDHYTYSICSDGDLMEGVSHEAASLAGHLQLGRLIYLYDSNRITIDGGTDLAFSEDVALRFQSYGWHVCRCDGLNVDTVDAAISDAKKDERPSLIICDTVIGFGSPNKAGKASSHGAALGEEEVRLSKIRLGIPEEPKFLVPEDALAHMREVGARHRAARIESERKAQVDATYQSYVSYKSNWAISFEDKPVATRAASGKTLNAIAEANPMLIGGSADLTESNQTEIKSSGPFTIADRNGRNIHFGVREHAMGCAVNGINLHGGARAFGGTFLIFSDYMRPSIRIAALMQCNSIFVFTHDSIGLGEDGPTHQPIEHLASLRAIPNLRVMRPSDANETAQAWRLALSRTDGPTAMALTRQALPLLSPADNKDFANGAYILKRESAATPLAVLIATGSEVEICVNAWETLEAAGIPTRVVSMPCWELFAESPKEYQDDVLPSNCEVRVSVEAAATLGWERWIGLKGKAIGLDHFGASAPFQTLYREFGLTPEHVCAAVKELLDKP